MDVDHFFNIAGGLARYDARTLSLADGAPVAEWGDTSGQLPSLVDMMTLAPDEYQVSPTYEFSAQGVLFSAEQRSAMQIPAEAVSDPLVGVTVVALVNKQSQDGVRQLAVWGDIATLDTGRWGLTTYPDDALQLYGYAISRSVSGVWSSGYSIVSVVSDTSGIKAGVQQSTMVAQVSPHNTLFAPRDEPGLLGRLFGGLVHDLLFFNRALTPAELAHVRAELAADWGI
ncbi:hypothetical protein DL240_09140 [Lujinxingia litoralis]|uniref:Uncharacterized protein n=1 Tax=Lujinxingia litoralis TaxID=2211119 RepID=A0A328C8N9_9DELT|nr:hypothetical protein [Lujinxingia litoralis]RAL23040.1 hypothetical protein DL240_09140 [Lujinxingia litoralis]